MQKYIIAILGLLFLSACSKSNESSGLKIEILNKEFYSVKNFDSLTIRNVMTYDNYIYDSLFVNKINIKISNTGNEKYVFFLKKTQPDFENFEKFKSENTKIIVYQNQQILPPSLKFLVCSTMQHPEMKKYINDTNHDTLEYNYYKNFDKEKADIKKIAFEREMQHVVIHPGESKFFSYYLTLPIFEKNTNIYMYKLKDSNNYFVQFSLKNDKEIISKYISYNQLKEIKENNYVIFNGTIKSNKVSIKFKTK